MHCGIASLPGISWPLGKSTSDVSINPTLCFQLLLERCWGKIQHSSPSQAPAQDPIPQELTAQALTCLRDFFRSHLTLCKVTGPSTGQGSWTGNNAAKQCAERHRRRVEEGKEAADLWSNFSSRWEAFSLLLIFFFFPYILKQTPFINVWRRLIILIRQISSL